MKKKFINLILVAKTKLFVEDLCRFYSKISKTSFTCIRHSNIYGPHDKFDLDKSHFFGATINKIFNSKNELTIWEFFLLIDFVYQFNVSSIPLSILYS